MVIQQIISLIEAHNFFKPSATGQIAGDLETAYVVDDLIKYAKTNLQETKIPLKLLINNKPPFNLEGSSDEPDNSKEFFSRTRGLHLRDFIKGNHAPIIVVKNEDGTYWVADGRHRVVTFVKQILIANHNPLDFSIKGHIIDGRLLQRKILSIAQQNDRI